MRLTFFIFVNDGKNLEQLQNPMNIRNVREIVEEEFTCQHMRVFCFRKHEQLATEII